MEEKDPIIPSWDDTQEVIPSWDNTEAASSVEKKSPITPTPAALPGLGGSSNGNVPLPLSPQEIQQKSNIGVGALNRAFEAKGAGAEAGREAKESRISTIESNVVRNAQKYSPNGFPSQEVEDQLRDMYAPAEEDKHPGGAVGQYNIPSTVKRDPRKLEQYNAALNNAKKLAVEKNMSSMQGKLIPELDNLMASAKSEFEAKLNETKKNYSEEDWKMLEEKSGKKYNPNGNVLDFDGSLVTLGKKVNEILDADPKFRAMGDEEKQMTRIAAISSYKSHVKISEAKKSLDADYKRKGITPPEEASKLAASTLAEKNAEIEKGINKINSSYEATAKVMAEEYQNKVNEVVDEIGYSDEFNAIYEDLQNKVNSGAITNVAANIQLNIEYNRLIERSPKIQEVRAAERKARADYENEFNQYKSGKQAEFDSAEKKASESLDEAQYKYYQRLKAKYEEQDAAKTKIFSEKWKKMSFEDKWSTALTSGSADILSFLGYTIGDNKVGRNIMDVSSQIKSDNPLLKVDYTTFGESVSNPDWWVSNVVPSLPLTATLMVPGIGGAMAVSSGMAMAGAGTILRAVGGGLIAGVGSRAMEAKMEGAMAAEELLAAGESPEYASEVASKVASSNMNLALMDAAEFTSILLPTKGFGILAAKVGGQVISNSLEEIYQEGLVNWQKEQRAVNEGKISKSEKFYSGGTATDMLRFAGTKEGKTVAISGGALGLAFGAAGVPGDIQATLSDKRISSYISEQFDGLRPTDPKERDAWADSRRSQMNQTIDEMFNSGRITENDANSAKKKVDFYFNKMREVPVAITKEQRTQLLDKLMEINTAQKEVDAITDETLKSIRQKEVNELKKQAGEIVGGTSSGYFVNGVSLSKQDFEIMSKSDAFIEGVKNGDHTVLINNDKETEKAFSDRFNGVKPETEAAQETTPVAPEVKVELAPIVVSEDKVKQEAAPELKKETPAEPTKEAPKEPVSESESNKKPTAESNVSEIFHGTTLEAAKQIEKSGFDINKTSDGTVWFTSNKDLIDKGEVAASGKGAVISRLISENELKLGGWDESEKYSVDELIRDGYDGVKLEGDGEVTYQIFFPEKLKANSKKDTQKAVQKPFVESFGTPVKDLSETLEGVSQTNLDGVNVLMSEVDENTVKLESIETPKGKRNKGKAKAALQKIIDKADELGKTVILDVNPKDETIDKDRLIKLYEGFGFTPTKGIGMERKPGAKPSAKQTPSKNATQKLIGAALRTLSESEQKKALDNIYALKQEGKEAEIAAIKSSGMNDKQLMAAIEEINERYAPVTGMNLGDFYDYNKKNGLNEKFVKAVDELVGGGKESKIRTDVSAKEYGDAMRAAMGNDRSDAVQVSVYSNEELADYQKSSGRRFLLTEDGLAGSYVDKNGYMGGLFKSSEYKGKGIAKMMQDARKEIGGKFFDAFDTYLTPIYTKNGWSPIIRMPFNPDYFGDVSKTTLKSSPDNLWYIPTSLSESKELFKENEINDYDAAYAFTELSSSIYNPSPKNELERLRNEMNAINDSIILHVYNKKDIGKLKNLRDEVSKKIAKYKSENGIETLDKGREASILSYVEKQAKILSIDPEVLKSLFVDLMSASRSKQDSERKIISSKTQGFFSDVVTGKSDKYKPKKKWSPISLLTESQSAFMKLMDKYVGNFDVHIATSIPTFRETQAKVGNAVVSMFYNPSESTTDKQGALVYDIGGSEGGFVKAISEASNGSIRTINLDPNPDMKKIHESSPVDGSEFVQEAFYEGFDDYVAHSPKEKADVVHEAMAFQFIGPERDGFVKEIKSKYIADGGIFVTEEKFNLSDKKEYAANEKKKSEYKDEYFSKEQQLMKSDDVLVGMSENQALLSDYEKALRDNFKYVEQYWDSGNFKGFVASDSKKNVDDFMRLVGDTSSEFSTKKLVNDSKSLSDKEIALANLEKARKAFSIAMGKAQMGGFAALPEFAQLTKALFEAGFQTVKEFIQQFRSMFPDEEISDEELTTAFKNEESGAGGSGNNKKRRGKQKGPKKGKKKAYEARQLKEFSDSQTLTDAIKATGTRYEVISWKDVQPISNSIVADIFSDPSTVNEKAEALADTIAQTTNEDYRNNDGLSTLHALVAHQMIAEFARIGDVDNFQKWSNEFSQDGRWRGRFISAMQHDASPYAISNRVRKAAYTDMSEAIGRTTADGTKIQDEIDALKSKLKLSDEEVGRLTSIVNQLTQNQAPSVSTQGNQPASPQQQKKGLDRVKSGLAKLGAAIHGTRGQANALFPITTEMVDAIKEIALGITESGVYQVEKIRKAVMKQIKAAFPDDKNAVDSIDAALDGILEDDTISEAIDEAEEAALVEKLVARAKMNAVTKTPKAKTAEEVLLDTLLAKMNETIKKESPKREIRYVDRIREGIVNAEYSDEIWREAMMNVEIWLGEQKNISDERRAEILASMEDSVSAFMDQPFANSDLRKALKQGIKDLGVEIARVVKEHWSVQDNSMTSIQEKLISELGLSIDDANRYSDAIIEEIEKIFAESRASEINKMLGLDASGAKKQKKDSVNKRTSDKILQAINLGVMDDYTFRSLFAEKYGFIAFSPADIRQILRFNDLINIHQGREMSRFYLKQMMDYVENLKPYDAEKFYNTLQSLMIRGMLNGLNTMAVNIPIGSQLSYMASVYPSLFANPVAYAAFRSSFGAAGLGGIGTKSFADIMSTGFNVMDEGADKFDDRKDVRGDQVDYWLNNYDGSRFWSNVRNSKSPKEAIDSIRIAMGRSMIMTHKLSNYAKAFDAIINFKATELDQFMQEYEEQAKAAGYSGMRARFDPTIAKEILDAVKKKMAYDKETVDEITDMVDSEIAAMRTRGERVGFGLRQRMIKAEMESRREQAKVAQSLERVRAYVLMENPTGILGEVYGIVAEKLAINKGISPTKAFGKYAAKSMFGLFLRITVTSFQKGVENVPVIGLTLPGIFYDKKLLPVDEALPNGKKEWRWVAQDTQTRNKKLATHAVTMAIFTLAATSMFSMDDEEDEVGRKGKKLKLNPDRWLDITGFGTGKFYDNESLRKEGKERKDYTVSIKVNGKWHDIMAARLIPHLMPTIALLGGLRDEAELNPSGFKNSKIDEQILNGMDDVVFASTAASFATIPKNTQKLFYAASGAESASQGVADLISESASILIDPTRAAVYPNFLRDIRNEVGAVAGTPSKMGRGVLYSVAKDFPIAGEMVGEDMYDVFGYQKIRTSKVLASLTSQPGATMILDNLIDNGALNADRFNQDVWKLKSDYQPNIVIASYFPKSETPEDKTMMNAVYGEQMRNLWLSHEKYVKAYDFGQMTELQSIFHKEAVTLMEHKVGTERVEKLQKSYDDGVKSGVSVVKLKAIKESLESWKGKVENLENVEFSDDPETNIIYSIDRVSAKIEAHNDDVEEKGGIYLPHISDEE